MKYLLICFAVFTAYAQTPDYWVTDSASGSGDGSQGNPWTLQQAFDTAIAGDDVAVQAGTYPGSYTQSNNGTVNDSIRFIGYVSSFGDITSSQQTTQRTEFGSGPISFDHTLWTEQQRLEVKARLDAGDYRPNSNTNFSNYVSTITTEKDAFVADPAVSRYLSISTGTPIPAWGYEYTGDPAQVLSEEPKPGDNTGIDYIFKAAVWAWAYEDVSIANQIANEILWHASNANYDFGNTAKFLRTRTIDVNPYFVQAAWIEKYHTIWHEVVKQLESTLTAGEITTIDNWFADAADWLYNAAGVHLDLYMGNDWENLNVAESVGIEFLDSTPLENSGGTPYSEWAVSAWQESMNNRVFDAVSYVHAYGIEHNNSTYRQFGTAFFKLNMQYMVYLNGIMAEIKRTTDAAPNLGVQYIHICITGLVMIAHAEQAAWYNGKIQANGWTRENLYTYSTTAGHENGVSYNGHGPYLGGSTTDGVTQKNLLMVLQGITKFFRSPANGGFNPPFYRNSVLIDATTSKFPVPYQMANAFYNNQTVFEHSVMDASAGLPSGTMDLQGTFGVEVGSWGKLFGGPVMWAEMENIMFGAAPPPPGPAQSSRAILRRRF